MQTKDHDRGQGGAGARAQADLVPGAARGAVPRALHSLVVAGTHGKTTTSSLASFVLTDAGKRSQLPRRWRADQLRPLAGGSARATCSSSRATSTTPRSSTRDRSSCTTGRRPRSSPGRARPRRHLLVARRGQGRRSQVRRAHPARRPAACRRRLAGRARRRARSGEVPRRDATSCATTEHPDAQADWIAPRDRARAPADARSFEVDARRRALRRLRHRRCPARYNLANALAVIAASRSRRACRRARSRAGCAASPASSAARKCAASRRASPSSTTSRTTRPRCARRCARCAARYGGGRLIAIFEPRSATSRRACSRKISPTRSPTPTRSSSAR